MIVGNPIIMILKAIQLRNKAFQTSDTDHHPNPKGHLYRSTIIENFLRRL